MKKLSFIFVTLLWAVLVLFSSPTSQAPIPNIGANDTVLYSDTTGGGFYYYIADPYWCTPDDKISISGSEIIVVQNNFIGYEFLPKLADLSGYAYVKISFFLDSNTTHSLKLKLVDFGTNGVYGGGDDSEHEVQLYGYSRGSWNTVTYNLQYLWGQNMNLDNVSQMFLTSTDTTKNIWVDNIYFTKGNLPSPLPTPYTYAKPTVNADVPNIETGDIVLYSNESGGTSVDLIWKWWCRNKDDKIFINDNSILVMDAFSIPNEYDHVGYEFSPVNIDASNLSTMDLAIWSEDSTSCKIKLVDWGLGGTHGYGDDTEDEKTVTISPGEWNYVSLDLATFTMNKASISQLIISPQEDTRIFVDNILFKNEYTARQKAVNWFKDQQDSMPEMTTNAQLVASFQGASISYLYDQAIAIMVFSREGYIDRAKKVLNALKYARDNADTLNADPNDPVAHDTVEDWLFNGYNSDGTYAESAKRTGPNMWLSMAIYHYSQITGDTSYDQFGEDILDHAISNFLGTDNLINGGLGYAREIFPWASIEENEDCFAVFNMYGKTTEADNIEDTIFNAPAPGPWYFYDSFVGHHRFAVGRSNWDPFMDTNPWGVLAFGTDYADCMNLVEIVHRSVQVCPNHGGATLEGYDYNWPLQGDIRTENPDDIWWEGTAFVALVYKVMYEDTGNQNYLNNYDFLLTQIEATQESTGGINYSEFGTNNIYWDMSPDEGCASTGWYIFAKDGFNPFQQ